MLPLILFISSAQAEGGVSYLGLCSSTWNCKDVLATWQDQPKIVTGWIENSFGESCACANKILADPRPKVIRVHLTNSPCMRNKRCGKHEVLAKETAKTASAKILRRDPVLMRKFRKVLTRFKQQIKPAVNLTCYVSPCLECDLYAPARKVLFGLVSRRLPSCVPVDNSYKQRCLPNTVCEKHGADPKLSQPCIADLDGEDGKGVDLAAYKANTKDCLVRYYWTGWMNCIASGAFVDPLKRNCNYPRKLMRKVGRIVWDFLSDH